MPIGFMTGGEYQSDQPPGSLCAPPRVVFHCDPRVGQSALPPLPYMWHVHIKMGIKRQASLHFPMCTGVEAEMLPSRSRGVRGGDGTHHLRPPHHISIFLQIPGTGPLGIRQWLAGSNPELAERLEEMSAAIMGAWMVGVGWEDVGNVLYRSGSGGTPIQVKDVVHVPADWEDDGRFSPSGDTAADGEYATAERGW